MNEKEFSELIRRCLSGEASKEEASLVEEWLDRRTEEDPFDKLGAPEKEKIRAGMFNRLSSRAMGGARMSAGKPWTKRLAFYQAAAAIMLLCVLSYSLLQLQPGLIEEKTTVLHSVSTGGTKKVILSDSSIVWLKGNSSIIYLEKFSDKERNVKLTGEALFEVAKDTGRPFIIECGDLSAKVLGTSFNIKSNENDVEVFVLTGKVALSSKGNSDALIVHPNEKAVYRAAGNHMSKVMAKEKELAAKIEGTQYSMRFSATPIQEIIRRIEGKFDVRVSLSDEKLNNCTITADFTDQSLERTLSMISETLGIGYEINNGHVTLSGAGCN